MPQENDVLGVEGSAQDSASLECLTQGTLDAATTKELVKALSALQLDLQLQRDFERTDMQLRDLEHRASTSEPSEAQWELLVRIALARSNLNLQRDRPELAWQEVNRLRRVQIAESKEEMVALGLSPLTQSMRMQETNYLSDARLVELRKRIERAKAAPRTTQVEPTLDPDDPYVRTVLDLVRNHDCARLRELGMTVLPILEQAALAETEAFPSTLQRDILHCINQISTLRAARVALEGLNRGGDIWRLRVVRLVDTNGVDGLRDSQRDESARRWGAVIEKLLQEPKLAAAILPRAMEVYAAGYQGDALRAHLISAWLSPDPEVRQGVVGYLTNRHDCDPYLSLLSAMLAEDSPDERRFAAELIADKCTRLGELSQCTNDPDPRIRSALVRAVGGRVDKAGRHISEEYRRIVERMSTDESLEVRSQVLRVLERDLLGPKPEQAYLNLARDADVSLRRRVSRLSLDSRSELWTDLLEILAADEDPEVVAPVDNWLRGPFDRRVMYENRAEFWPTVAARLRNPRLPFTDLASPEERTSIYQRFFASGLGTTADQLTSLTEAVAHSALKSNDDRLLSVLFVEDRSSEMRPATVGLPLEILEPLTLRALNKETGVTDGKTFFWGMLAAPYDNDPILTKLCDLVTVDNSSSRTARVHAAMILGYRKHVNIAICVRRVFESPDWKLSGLTESEPNALYFLGESIDASVRDSLTRDLIGNPKIHAAPLNFFVNGAYNSSLLEPDTANALLARFFDGKESKESTRNMVGLALRSVASEPSSVNAERFAVALKDPEFTLDLVRRLGQVPHPRWLPLLAECLQPEWMPSSSERLKVALNAASAVANLYSDEASAVLLEGMRRASDDSLRTKCQEALEQIRLFREEEEKLAGRRTASLARDEAIVDLLELLDDPEPSIQIEALRALATLGAVDALPKMIRKLRSSDPDVRLAAQEAMNRLNREDREDREVEESAEDE